MVTRTKRLAALLSALPDGWPEPKAIYNFQDNDACHVEFRKDGNDFLNLLCGIHNYAVGDNGGVAFFPDSELPKVVERIGDFLGVKP